MALKQTSAGRQPTIPMGVNKWRKSEDLLNLFVERFQPARLSNMRQQKFPSKASKIYLYCCSFLE